MVSGRMIKAVTNEPQHLLTVNGIRLHARALPIAQAMPWSEDARAAMADIEKATTYAEKDAAYVAAARCLASYPALTSGLKDAVPDSVIDALTVEQVEESITVLLEVNDPFTRARARRAQAQAEEERRTRELLAALPPEQVQTILATYLQNQPVPSAKPSE